MPRLVLLGPLALLLVSGAPLRAQGTAPPRWELLGLEEQRLKGLFFALGQADDGSDDALYAHGGHGLWRRPPEGPWSADLHTPTGGAEYAILTKEGYLIVGAPAGPTNVDRSTNGGQTWERDVHCGGTVLFQSTLPALGGAVYVCDLGYCYRSFDGGARGSWETVGARGGWVDVLDEVPPSGPLPEGRLLAGLWNGLAYSDDGGVTWAPSSLWAPGALIVNSLAFDAVAGHPYGGAVYAGVVDLRGEERIAVHRSEDGGRTRAEVRAFAPGEFGVATPHWVVVTVDERPGGALYAGIEQVLGGTTRGLGTVVASFDGGQTWHPAVDAAAGWGGYAVRELVVGRDGRLYAATDAGVYRTVEGVPIPAEPGPGEETGVRLEVRPNPARGTAQVEVLLDRPSAVSVSVYDALGRPVAVLASGPMAAGRHVLPLDGSDLPAGVYLVRVDDGAAVVTRRLTLVR